MPTIHDTRPVFSSTVPGLRLAHRPSSLAAYMVDPMSYALRWVHGYEEAGDPSPAAYGGTLYHECRQEFDRLRLLGPVDVDAWLSWCYHHILSSELPTLAANHRTPDRYSPLRLFNALVWYAEALGNSDPIVPDDWGKGDGDPIEQTVEIELPFKACTGEPYRLYTSLDLLCKRTDDPDGVLGVREIKTVWSGGSYYTPKYESSLQVAIQQLIQRHVLGRKYPITFLDLTYIHSFQEKVVKGEYKTGPRKGQPKIGNGRKLECADFDRKEVSLADLHLNRWLLNIQYWLQRIEMDTLDGFFKDPALICPFNPAGQIVYESEAAGPSTMRLFRNADVDVRRWMLENQFIKTENLR